MEISSFPVRKIITTSIRLIHSGRSTGFFPRYQCVQFNALYMQFHYFVLSPQSPRMDWMLARIRSISAIRSSVSASYPVYSKIFTLIPQKRRLLFTSLSSMIHQLSRTRILHPPANVRRGNSFGPSGEIFPVHIMITYTRPTFESRAPLKCATRPISTLRHNSFPIKSILLLDSQIIILEFHLDIANSFVPFHIPRSSQLLIMYTICSPAVLSHL